VAVKSSGDISAELVRVQKIEEHVVTDRAVSAALHTPQLEGGHAVTEGPKFQSCHHFAPQRKLRFPKLKYEALEISEVRVPFERKVHYSFFGPF